MLLSIRNAAKEVHRSPEYVRDLVEAGKLRAVKAGGGKFLRLRVDPKELEALLRREEEYVPRGLKQPTRHRPTPKLADMHPAALAM